jgi:hypothetical protein
MTKNRELQAGLEEGPAFQVGKVSLGAVRELWTIQHVSIGAGGLFAINFVPDALAPLYGGRNPKGMMGFIRLGLN